MTENTSKQAILILGMHRSGTSLLTRILNLHGVALAPDLADPNEFNERGYWESKEVQGINDLIFNELRTTWFDCYRLSLSEIPKVKIELFRNKIIDFLNENFAKSTCVLFAIKDPRICKLLPIWQDALESFGAKVSVIIPFRNPLEVAESLEKRDGLTNQYSLVLWLRHLLDSERYSRDLNRAFISFDGLLLNWRTSIERISKDLGVEWPVLSDTIEKSIEGFLSPQLKHHNHTDGEIKSFGLLGDMALQILTGLKELESGKFNGDIKSEFGGVYGKMEYILQKPKVIVPEIVKKYFSHQRYLNLLEVENSKLRELEIAFLMSSSIQEFKISELKSSKRSELQVISKELKKEDDHIKQQKKQTILLKENLKLSDKNHGDELARLLKSQEILNKQLAGTKEEKIALQTTLKEHEAQLARFLKSQEILNKQLADFKEEKKALQTIVKDREVELGEAESRFTEIAKSLNFEKKISSKLTEDLQSANTLFMKASQGLEESHRENVDLTDQQIFQSRKFGQLQYQLEERNRIIQQNRMKLAQDDASVLNLKLEINRLEKENRNKAASLKARFDDVAIVTRKLEVLEKAQSGRFLKLFNPLVFKIRVGLTLLRIKSTHRLIEKSKLFDRDWYVQQYPDVLAAGVDPIMHYLLSGAAEGREPGPDFDSYRYLLENPDVALEEINPLVHFVKFGLKEGRKVTNKKDELHP
jgi:hypothetical protein